MRVVAGQFRGRALLGPPGRDTRPILDRVKVALFDWLGARLALPGSLPPLHVLDMFCGTGSLGIEALSRGAATCTFVDSAADAIALLRRNLAALAIAPARAVVVQGAAQRVPIAQPGEEGFGLVFLDPPYSLSEDVAADTLMGGVVARLGTELGMQPGAILVWRHDQRRHLPAEMAAGWRSIERRAWGNMAVTMYQRTAEARP